jgi:acyl-CoA reductase-like NAD-dependent aldehyde dehydrogenase
VADTLLDALSEATLGFIRRTPQPLLIGGERPLAADGRTFETFDPATGNTICEVAQAGSQDVELAVDAARGALDGPLRKVSPAKRSALMNALADLIKAHGEELAQLESLDNGKPVKMAAGDVAATVNHLRYYAGWPTKIEGETLPVSARDVLCYTLREPVGVCAQIVPWNFPLLMAAWKVAPALAAGCPVVLKPAEQTPLSALRLGELALEAGFPEGTLNVLTGDGETGAALVDHPGVQKVAFTGSTAVGREIGAKCGKALKRVTLELGGKSPVIVDRDFDLKTAAHRIAYGKLANGGQTCVAPDYVLVPEGEVDAFVAAFTESVARLYPDIAENPDYTWIVSDHHFGRLTGLLDDAKAKGARVIDIGGARGGGAQGQSRLFLPALVLDTTDEMKVVQEEIFGPILPVLPYRTLEDAVAYVNARPRPLALYYFGPDGPGRQFVLSRTASGNVTVNDTMLHYAQEDLPFGGVGLSGMGAYHAREGFKSMSHAKGVFEQARFNLTDLLRPPYTRIFDFLLRWNLR